jgi:hypothetical protein
VSKDRHYEPLKYPFSQDEIRQLGEALARESQNVMTLHETKSSTAAAFAAQIKQGQEKMAELTQKINNGYEIRDVECLILMETPRPGMKQLRRIDTSEWVRDEPMTAAEMQGEFGFRDGGDPRPDEHGGG